MAELRNKRNNSLPSLTMNKFFVSKRASMFEVYEESPREKRDRSPCGMLEVSERKLKARKEKEKKESMSSRKKRQADPYAEESTELEEEDNLEIVEVKQKVTEKTKKETKICGHVNRSVNLSLVRRYLKNSLPIGECVHCKKAKAFTECNEDPSYAPVIWLCAFCGYQGCDRNSPGKHSFLHYKTPRSDPHCVVINTHTWTVWCYECDSEIVQTSSKKLHEVIQHAKRLSEMAPKRNVMSQLTVASNRPSTNLTTQYSGSDSRLYTRTSYEEIARAARNQKHQQESLLASLPRVKGISNLGNTCFFNSVIQSLAQTHFLTQLLDVHMQSGQKVALPGTLPEEYKKLCEKKINENNKYNNGESKDGSDEDLDDDEVMELKPLDLFLPEGGPISLALCVFLKDMHSVGKNGVINPGHLFGQICKKSTQFQGYEQQDAHELLRCMLDAIRNEEIVRNKKSILKAFALSEKTDPNTVNSRLKKIIKGYGKQASHTIIDQIFGGQLISTVFCEECHWSSQVFEPLMDLSLPINEEKGKPRKSSSFEDESILDCFGRSNTNNSSPLGISKYQQKKMKKAEKAKNRKNKGRGNVLTPSCIKGVADEKDEEKEREEKRKKRLTEKRRPEDEEEYRLKEEADRKLREERNNNVNKRKGESSKFKQLMHARNASKREEGGSEQEEESDEELEYDQEDDEDEDSLALSRRKKESNDLTNYQRDKLPSTDLQKTKKVDEDEDEEEEEEDEEEEEEDEEEEEEEETETNEDTESDVSSTRNSKSKRTSRETSDADVEDNTDSEYIRNSCCQNTRHPSIVVDDTSSDQLLDLDTTVTDNRYLMTCNSCDHLNYNSASDTSERYFTAAGADTMDELDNLNADSTSLRSSHTNSTTTTTTTTSGKGDSISISSGDTIDHYDERNHDRKVLVDPEHMEEMCLKVGELKIRRKSSSKESLLDSHQRGSNKRGSTETLHTFNNNERNEEEGTLQKKALAIKKLKQDWIARSLTTLAPRYQCGRQECSVMSCLASFTAPELLTGNNKITCENCTKLRLQSGEENTEEAVKSNASKQLLIFSPPAVLTLHLKRFHHVGYNLTKVNKYVQFPLILDIAPFTSSISQGLSNMSRGQAQVLYGLYGVVEHSGRLNSGHYVAYVRSRPLDTSRTCKQMLNLKPSSQFEINHLVSEMTDRLESEKGILNGGFKSSHGSGLSINIEPLEEEVKSGRWYHVSDSYVSEVNVEKVLKAQAYLLFYERLL